MFGFLRGSRRHTVYRQVYAQCCQWQHAEFGLSTLPALSYEAVSLYLLCLDAGQVPRPDEGDPLCCRLRRRTQVIEAEQAPIGRYCVASGVYLAQIKLEDDLRDAGSIVSRFLLWWYGRRFQRAREILTADNPELLQNLRQRIDDHLELESARTRLPLAEYATPTGEAFGELFASVTPLLPGGSEDLVGSFRQIGQLVGKAIIQFDCAADWWRDARTGQFNPVRSRQEADEALVDAADSLIKAAERCRFWWGHESESARLFSGRARSLLERPRTDALRLAALERAGLTREPGYTYAFCDGCDCGGCDCGGCDCAGCDGPGCEAGGGVDAASGCGECCIVVPIDCCCCWESSSQSKSQAQKPDQKSPTPRDAVPSADLIGKVGVAITQLTPAGVVEVDGQRYAATVEGPSLDSQTPIVVLTNNAHGLVVRHHLSSEETP
ncbi:MAG: NfeD family protein [Planctomycetaceae bacterium]|nr:NfeD family protein [Planctomycetaceae bacterium]